MYFPYYKTMMVHAYFQSRKRMVLPTNSGHFFCDNYYDISVLRVHQICLDPDENR